MRPPGRTCPTGRSGGRAGSPPRVPGGRGRPAGHGASRAEGYWTAGDGAVGRRMARRGVARRGTPSAGARGAPDAGASGAEEHRPPGRGRRNTVCWDAGGGRGRRTTGRGGVSAGARGGETRARARDSGAPSGGARSAGRRDGGTPSAWARSAGSRGERGVEAPSGGTRGGGRRVGRAAKLGPGGGAPAAPESLSRPPVLSRPRVAQPVAGPGGRSRRAAEADGRDCSA